MKSPKHINPRAEVLLTHLNMLIDYWSKQDNEPKDNIEGMVFSFLVMIDGGSAFPEGIDLIDRESGETISTGYLHEILQNYKND